MAAITKQTYTPAEEAEIAQWNTTAERLAQSPSDASILDALNTHLSSRTTVLGAKPSFADVELFKALAPTVKTWTSEQRTGKEGRPHIVRHLDFVQNSSGIFGLDVPDSDKIAVNPEEVLYVKPPVDAKAEKERLKKEKAATTTAETQPKIVVDRTKDAAAKVGNMVAEAKDKIAASVSGDGTQQQKKKEKKEKAAKPQKAPAVTAAPSPGLIDLRVGHILKAIKHPEADSLYVSTIAMGDPAGTPDTEEYQGQVVRTVCSGLNGLVPLEEMQGRKVVVVCNLKPVKMRGVKSCAMVLAASPRLKDGETDDHKGPVELVSPPIDSPAGMRVFFDGWKAEPEKQLNPKKKIWEMFQPGFTTTDELEVAFDAGAVADLGKQGLGKLVTEDGKVCTVKSLKGATVR